jgi:hypothetical protein
MTPIIVKTRGVLLSNTKTHGMGRMAMDTVKMDFGTLVGMIMLPRRSRRVVSHEE